MPGWTLLLALATCTDGSKGAGKTETCSAASPGSCSKPSATTNRASDLIDAGHAALQKHNYDQALNIFREVATLPGALPEQKASAETNIGTGYRRLGKNVEALPHLRRGVQYAPQLFLGQLALANALKDEKDWDGCDAHYTEALKILPSKDTGALVRTNHAACLRSAFNDGAGNQPHFARRDLLREANDHLQVVLNSGQAERTTVTQLSAVLHEQGKQVAQRKLLKWAVGKGLYQDRRQYPDHLNKNLPAPKHPWWDDHARLPLLAKLRENWLEVRGELDTLMHSPHVLAPMGNRVASDSDLYDRKRGQTWHEHNIVARGIESSRGALWTPVTAKLLRGEQRVLPPSGQIGFSVLGPNSQVKPHCGKTNEVITCHLGLHVPAGGKKRVGISVGGETRSWVEGEWLCFEDSFEHEVWNNTTEALSFLLVSMLHPLLWPKH